MKAVVSLQPFVHGNFQSLRVGEPLELPEGVAAALTSAGFVAEKPEPVAKKPVKKAAVK